LRWQVAQRVGNWRNRLSPAKRRVYDRSDAVTAIALRPGSALLEAVRGLQRALGSANQRHVAQFSQRIADGICTSLGVPGLKVLVRGRRPSSSKGELHGLYMPGEHSRRDTVKLWMITAKRGQVVAFRTFLRTLVHELCHHLDYTLLGLPDSYHTGGFYVRESGMLRSLTDGQGFEQSSGATVARGGSTVSRLHTGQPGWRQ
jgi:hypothetical protein